MILACNHTKKSRIYGGVRLVQECGDTLHWSGVVQIAVEVELHAW
jgi:hypothetical protein